MWYTGITITARQFITSTRTLTMNKILQNHDADQTETESKGEGQHDILRHFYINLPDQQKQCFEGFWLGKARLLNFIRRLVGQH